MEEKNMVEETEHERSSKSSFSLSIIFSEIICLQF